MRRSARKMYRHNPPGYISPIVIANIFLNLVGFQRICWNITVINQHCHVNKRNKSVTRHTLEYITTDKKLQVMPHYYKKIFIKPKTIKQKKGARTRAPNSHQTKKTERGHELRKPSRWACRAAQYPASEGKSLREGEIFCASWFPLLSAQHTLLSHYQTSVATRYW